MSGNPDMSNTKMTNQVTSEKFDETCKIINHLFKDEPIMVGFMLTSVIMNQKKVDKKEEVNTGSTQNNTHEETSEVDENQTPEVETFEKEEHEDHYDDDYDDNDEYYDDTDNDDEYCKCGEHYYQCVCYEIEKMKEKEMDDYYDY